MPEQSQQEQIRGLLELQILILANNSSDINIFKIVKLYSIKNIKSKNNISNINVFLNTKFSQLEELILSGNPFEHVKSIAIDKPICTPAFK